MALEHGEISGSRPEISGNGMETSKEMQKQESSDLEKNAAIGGKAGDAPGEKDGADKKIEPEKKEEPEKKVEPEQKAEPEQKTEPQKENWKDTLKGAMGAVGNAFQTMGQVALGGIKLAMGDLSGVGDIGKGVNKGCEYVAPRMQDIIDGSDPQKGKDGETKGEKVAGGIRAVGNAFQSFGQVAGGTGDIMKGKPSGALSVMQGLEKAQGFLSSNITDMLDKRKKDA